jgi:quinol monooxygenase YgiN
VTVAAFEDTCGNLIRIAEVSRGKTDESAHAELHVLARFHAQAGREQEVADALAEVVPPSRAEPGCLAIQPFRAARDPRLFFVTSRWKDESAFDHHATLAHTVRFVERVSAAIDHPLEVNRARLLPYRGSREARSIPRRALRGAPPGRAEEQLRGADDDLVPVRERHLAFHGARADEGAALAPTVSPSGSGIWRPPHSRL